MGKFAGSPEVSILKAVDNPEKVHLGAAALVGQLLLRSQKEVQTITLDNAQYLIRSAFEEGFMYGLEAGRMKRSQELSSILGVRSRFEKLSAVKYCEGAFVNFRLNSTLYRSMFPDDKVTIDDTKLMDVEPDQA